MNMSHLCRRLVVLLSLLVLISTAHAQSSNRRDGNWWRAQDRQAKVDYMIGFFDGMSLGNNFSYWKYVNQTPPSNVPDLVLESYNEYTEKYMMSVSSGQMTDGLDSFFSDYRNRSIRINNEPPRLSWRLFGVSQTGMVC